MIAAIIILFVITLINSALIVFLMLKMSDVKILFDDHKENIENIQVVLTHLLEQLNIK